MNNNDYTKILRQAYAFHKVLYSMPFKERLALNLGVIKITTSPTEESKLWSKEELEQKLIALKRPWWNRLFKLFGKY